MTSWQQVSSWGIRYDALIPRDEATIFQAGKLDDVLRLPIAEGMLLLVASEESGVWQVDPKGGEARCLSLKWDRPAIKSLASGLRSPFDVYAGGTKLWETDTSIPQPLNFWKEIPFVDKNSDPLPTIGEVHDIVVVPNPRLVVLACYGGVFYSEIPDVGGYTYKFATAISGPRFSSLAIGPNDSVYAATWTTGASAGIWRLAWDPTSKIFTSTQCILPPFYDPAKTIPFDVTLLGRMSISSCTLDTRHIYACAANRGSEAGQLYCVLRSIIPTDGLITDFEMTSTNVAEQTLPLFSTDHSKWDLGGNQGHYNQCISASSTTSGLLAMGWRSAIFISADGGDTWNMSPKDSDRDIGWHAGFHSVQFDQFDSTQKTLYVCSDGGLRITNDRGVRYSDMANRHLPNLPCTKAGIGPLFPRPVIIAVKDNGGLLAPVYPLDKKPLKHVVNSGENHGNAGRTAIALANNRVLYTANPDLISVHDFIWNQATAQATPKRYSTTLNGIIPLDSGDPQGLDPTQGIFFHDSSSRFIQDTKFAIPICTILHSRYMNTSGETMVALAVTNNKSPTGVGKWVYGLFVKGGDGFANNPAHWTPLESVTLVSNEEITAVSTFDGNLVWIGTTHGRIISLVSSATTPWGSTARVSNFLDLSGNTHQQASGRIIDLAFANDGMGWTVTSMGSAYSLRPNSDGFPIWHELRNPLDFHYSDSSYAGYISLACYRRVPRPVLFVADSTDVWSTEDDGAAWTNISGFSNGLPVWAGCTDLSVDIEEAGAAYLYLATYGHSMYRRLLNNPDPQTLVVQISGEMGFLVRHTFGDDPPFQPPIFPKTFSLNALDPYQEFETTESFQDLSVKLRITMAKQGGPAVLVRFFVDFNKGKDLRENSFRLERLTDPSKHTNAEWADDDHQIDVNFDVKI